MQQSKMWIIWYRSYMKITYLKTSFQYSFTKLTLCSGIPIWSQTVWASSRSLSAMHSPFSFAESQFFINNPTTSYPGIREYRNVPKFSDRWVWANSADPDQTAPRVDSVCNSDCIFWVHCSLVKPFCSNFRAITANCLGVQIFRIFTVP